MESPELKTRLDASPSLDKIKSKAVPILKRHGVVRASLFGSVARGEAGPESDLDLLIDVGDNRMTLFGLQRLEDDLSAELGRKIDLVFFECIKRRIREKILSQQVPVL